MGQVSLMNDLQLNPNSQTDEGKNVFPWPDNSFSKKKKWIKWLNVWQKMAYPITLNSAVWDKELKVTHLEEKTKQKLN